MLTRRSLLRGSAIAPFAIAGTSLFRGIDRALAQNGDYELVCNANDVRVRAEPGLSGAVLRTVSTGDGVWVTGQSTEADGYVWIPITVMGSGNLAGYAAQEFFVRPDGGTGFIRGTTVHVTSGNVNLRAGAGLDQRIIGNFSTDTNAVVNDGPTIVDGYDWYNITIDGLTGWMAADFLAEGSSDPGQQPSTAFPVGSYVRPTDPLNLRSGPGTGNGVIGVYGTDTVATVLGEPQLAGMYLWYQVEVWDDGAVGWFANPYLEAARFEPTGARYEVVDGPLNLREGGSTSAAIIDTLATGTVVVVADASFGNADGYTWMYVYVEDNPKNAGFVAREFTREL